MNEEEEGKIEEIKWKKRTEQYIKEEKKSKEKRRGACEHGAVLFSVPRQDCDFVTYLYCDNIFISGWNKKMAPVFF